MFAVEERLHLKRPLLNESRIDWVLRRALGRESKKRRPRCAVQIGIGVGERGAVIQSGRYQSQGCRFSTPAEIVPRQLKRSPGTDKAFLADRKFVSQADRRKTVPDGGPPG